MLPSLNILRPAGNQIELLRQEAHGLTENHPFPQFNARYYASGTAALASAMIASAKNRPDITEPEVIIPAYGCPDLISAAVFSGLKPVLVDLEPDLPCIDLNQLQEALSPQTVAIVGVRFFGLAERNKELKSIALSHNLTFIEDSAQGFPNTDLDSYWQGDYIILSFGRGKPINLLGGGAVLCRDETKFNNLTNSSMNSLSTLNYQKLALKLHTYNFIINPLIYGLISRIPGLHIGETIYKPLHNIEGINNMSLSMLPGNINAYQQRDNLQTSWSSALKALNSDQIIDIPRLIDHDMKQPLLRYPILIKNQKLRDSIFEQTYRFGTSLMYQKPLNQIDNVEQFLKEKKKTYANALNFSNRLITLPTHQAADQRTINYIVNIITELTR